MLLYELGDSSGKVSLQDLCNDKLVDILTGEVELRSIADYIVHGGFLGAIDLSVENTQLISKSYIEIVLNDDAQRI